MKNFTLLQIISPPDLLGGEMWGLVPFYFENWLPHPYFLSIKYSIRDLVEGLDVFFAVVFTI